MTVIYYQDSQETPAKAIALNEGESLLDGLLRLGYDVPFGCKSGVCQSCLMRATDGNIPEQAQAGLKPTQIEQGYFLSCSCIPEAGFRACPPNLESALVAARVIDKISLTDDIFRLRVERVTSYKPGQFMTLWNENKVARSYSTASVPEKEDYIEFHIKRIADGAFSNWAWEQLENDDVIHLQGPLGECFYTKSDLTQPLFLSGIGTGLAPLYGIARDALNQGHTGDISLYVASKRASRFYLVEELLELQEQFDNFSVRFIAQEMENARESHIKEFVVGDIYQYTKEAVQDFTGFKVFLCGAGSFVKKMKKQCFLAGARLTEIMADPFIPHQTTQ